MFGFKAWGRRGTARGMGNMLVKAAGRQPAYQWALVRDACSGAKAPKGQRFHISSECLSWVGSGILCLQLVLGEWLCCRVGRGTEEAKYWNLCLGVSVVFKKAGVSDNQDPRGKQCLSVVSCGAQMHPTWKYLLCLSFYSTWVVFIY